MLPHDWEEDPREPLFSFNLGDSSYGFFMLRPEFWIETLSLLLCETLIAAVVGALLYHTVAQRQRTMAAYILGFGIFIPFWLHTPAQLLNTFGVKNRLMRFCLGGILPTTSMFRISEVVFGFVPEYALVSASQFSLYVASPMLLRHDAKLDKFVPTTKNFIIEKFSNLIICLFMVGAFQSLYELNLSGAPSFGPLPDDTKDYYSFSRLLDIDQLRDNLFAAILFQLYLCVFGEGLILLTSLCTGKEVVALMKNPIFSSTSPSDFWGHRWNHVVHKCLKNGVYKPVRSITTSPVLGTTAAFVTSGILHEWLLSFVFFDEHVNFGRTTGFFAWQAMLVMIESTCGELFSPLRRLPLSLQSALVILSGLPLAHWFTFHYVHSNFFSAGGSAFPMLKIIG